MAAAKNTTAPDFLTNAAWAGLVVKACADGADNLHKLGQEIGQASLVEPQVWMLRRAAHQLKALADEHPEQD